MDPGEQFVPLELCLHLSLFFVSLCKSGPFLIWGKNVWPPAAPSLVLYSLKFKSNLYPFPLQHLYIKDQRRLIGPLWVSVHPEPITAFKLIDTSLIGQGSICLSLGWSRGAVTDNLTLTTWTGGCVFLQGKSGWPEELRKGSWSERNKKCPSYPCLILFWTPSSFPSFHLFGHNPTLPCIGDVHIADPITRRAIYICG